jgi:hypothetical protein
VLARSTKLKLNNIEVGTTPMLIPSISSTLDRPDKLLDTVKEIVNGPILISAYDYYYSLGKKPKLFNFTDLLFLDSGGYECAKERDDIGLITHNAKPKRWSRKMHKKVVREWSPEIPTVVVSYDHPNLRNSVENQMNEALSIFDHDETRFLKEVLIKPEKKGENMVKVEKLEKHAELLRKFDIIGVTEKELGPNILQRMKNISKIRKTLDKIGIDIPVHIFGSMDTVTTPLYFLAGADIFDGLAWLRFSFDAGNTNYIFSSGPKSFGITENIRNIWIRTIYQNYNYLQDLKLQMEKYAKTSDFDSFKNNVDFFKESYGYLESQGV